MKYRVIALLTALILLLTACGQKAPTWQEQYDLGVRYLSEGNYEEAILAFTAAITIDPKQEQLYLSLAEAYAASGNTEMAAETLRNAIAELGETAAITEALTQFAPADPGFSTGADPTPTPGADPTPVPDPAQSAVRTERRDFPDGSWQIIAYYADGSQTVTEYYPNGGGHTVSEYNAAGWELRFTVYNPDGSINYYSIPIFDANNTSIGNTIHKPDGSVDFYYIWEYDANGRHTRTVFYNPDGSVQKITEN